MASHNKKYDNNHAEVIIALKDKAGHIHELEDQYIREKLDAEILTRENMFNALSAVLQNLYDEDDRIEAKFDGVIKDKLQDYFVYLGEFDRSGQAESAAANISNLNLSHSTILLYIYDKTKVGIIYNFLRHDGFFQLIELQGTKSFRYFKWNANKTSLTLQNNFEGINITAGWNNYTSKPFFEIGNKDSGTPYLNIYPLLAGGIVSYNIETLINLVDKYSLYSENGSTKFTTEEIQNWTMPDSPTLLNIIKNLYEKNNTYKSLLTSATNTITTLRTDLNAANNKLSQVSDAQYNAKLQQDLAIQLLSQSHQSNIQYLQERLNLNFSQDDMRYGEQTGVDKRQDEIINELLSYHTVTVTLARAETYNGSLKGIIEIPYNSEYMYITDTIDGDGQINDTLYINSSYLNQILSQYSPNIPEESTILYKVNCNGNNYYYANRERLGGEGESIPSSMPSANETINWLAFIQNNRESGLYRYHYITMPISWQQQDMAPTFGPASSATTSIQGITPVSDSTTPRAAGAGTPGQDINTQTINTQTTPTQTINTKTLPISGAPVTPEPPTETEVQAPTATRTRAQTTPTQTINTKTLTLAPTLGPTIGPTETQAQTTPTQTINTQTINTETMPAGPTRTIAPTATESQAPTGTQTTPTQTINTRTLPISGAPVTPGCPTKTEVQVPTATETQTQTTPTIAPTIGPTGRPAGYSLPSDNGCQYVYEGMTGVNIRESSIYVNPAIYSNLSKDSILIKHSDESYEYCDFIGICPDGVLSGYYIYNIRISDNSNIVTLPPQPTAILPAAARTPIPSE